MRESIQNNLDWWDSNIENSFFNLYSEGDDSLEGFYPDKVFNLSERTISEVNFIEKLLELENKDLILDCPCGIGRHSIELAKRGYKTRGIDLSEISIKEAVKKAKSFNNLQNVSFNVADKRNLPFENESFNKIINMFFSFGFFETDQENFSVLKEFNRVLKLNGKLLIHTDVNPNRIINNSYLDRQERKLKNGSMLLVDENWDSVSKRLNGKWKILNNNSIIKQANYSVRIFSNDELQEMLELAGFNIIAIFYKDDSLINNTNINAREVIYIATK